MFKLYKLDFFYNCWVFIGILGFTQPIIFVSSAESISLPNDNSVNAKSNLLRNGLNALVPFEINFMGFIRQCYSNRIRDVRNKELYFIREITDKEPYNCSQYFQARNESEQNLFVVLDCDIQYIKNRSCSDEFLKVIIDSSPPINICDDMFTGPSRWAGKLIYVEYKRINTVSGNGGYICSVHGIVANSSTDALDQDIFIQRTSGTDTKVADTWQCESCGIANFELQRIVGGREAGLEIYPWMAHVTVELENGKTHTCGGTLISRSDILTAGHCVDNKNIVKITVRLGFYDVTQDGEEGAIVDVTTNTLLHHYYPDTNFYRNDIALIRLSNPVREFTKSIIPACLPSSVHKSYANEALTVTGWGSKSELGTVSALLHEVNITAIENSKCDSIYSSFGFRIHNSSHICLYDQDKDACRGDSGGPAMQKIGKQWFMVGVVSFGLECAQLDVPGVYTRVSEFRTWLDNNMLDRCH